MIVCPSCGSSTWTLHYTGPIRNGSFGKEVVASIQKCSNCSLERLDDKFSLPKNFYSTSAYRDALEQHIDEDHHFKSHGHLLKYPLEILNHESFYKKNVLDLGCASGLFLDAIKGLANLAIGVEPCTLWHDLLKSKNIVPHTSTSEALATHGSIFDYVVSHQVIEHVDCPQSFVRDALKLLSPGGRLLLSTPNLDDILMHTLPNDFPSFFYRTQHKWYFNSQSLLALSKTLGANVEKLVYKHRYGFTNYYSWLKIKKPSGHISDMPYFDSFDPAWCSFLESTGRADNIFLVLTNQ